MLTVQMVGFISGIALLVDFCLLIISLDSFTSLVVSLVSLIDSMSNSIANILPLILYCAHSLLVMIELAPFDIKKKYNYLVQLLSDVGHDVRRHSFNLNGRCSCLLHFNMLCPHARHFICNCLNRLN